MPACISKTDRSALTRRALPETAHKLFAAQGYTATSILAIARRAKRPPDALQYHFADRATLAVLPAVRRSACTASQNHLRPPRWSPCVVFVCVAVLLLTGGTAWAQTNEATDRAALVALYNATNGANWRNNANWLSSEALSAWNGVTTDENGRVTELALDSNELSGEIPAALGNLTNLRKLDLCGNQLGGEIPAELGGLRNLNALSLYDNQLSGEIPAALGDLPNLWILHLWNNELSGGIPAELGGLPSLQLLSLYDNQLSGGIPAELGDLPKIRYLFLNDNPQLTGPLPSALENLTQLEEFDIHNTGLCVRAGSALQRWLATIDFQGVVCAAPPQFSATSTTREVPEHSNPSIDVGAPVTATDPNSDPLTYTLGGPDAQSFTIVSTTGQIRTKSGVTYDRETQSTYSVTVTADDGTATATIRVLISVTDVSEPDTPTDGGSLRGGSSGGGRGGSNRDRHGNTAARATPVSLGMAAPWTASTAGQINTPRDSDYFAVTLPQAGVFVVETTGPTDTQGTVWQAGEVLATAGSGGAQRNFRLSVVAEAGPVVVAVAGNGRQTGAYTLETWLVVGTLENPGPGSRQSGIGLLSGWVCDADVVELEINGIQRVAAAYGTARADTAPVCGDSDTGFGLVFNWNLLGDGPQTVVALADGVAFAQATFAVTTLGEEFVTEAVGETVLDDFPTAGAAVRLVWQQANQNFMLAPLDRESPPASPPSPAGGPPGALENPGPASFQSGLGLLSGWVCEAEMVEVEINGGAHIAAAYGTARADTAAVCGDTDNGFGLLFNWNLLGDGIHTAAALADGEEFGRATFTVTTLGDEFLEEAQGATVVEDFPVPGEAVRLVWQQANQNFVLAPLR